MPIWSCRCSALGPEQSLQKERVPDHRSCNRERRTSELAATVSWHDQLTPIVLPVAQPTVQKHWGIWNNRPIVCKPDDGAVVFISAMVVLHACVNDAADRLVYVIGADELQEFDHLQASRLANTHKHIHTARITQILTRRHFQTYDKQHIIQSLPRCVFIFYMAN